MNTEEPLFVSEAGREALRERLLHKRHQHKDICKEREAAHELSGDGWHDNPHFNHLQQMEANATREIMELEHQLGRSRVYRVREGERPTDQVAIGSIVTILMLHEPTGQEDERTFEIAGFGESDRDRRTVGYNVPLAGRLLGLAPGDVVEIALPLGRYEVEVVSLWPDRSTLDAG